MEKRRNNTLDRWQRLGFGRRTSSNLSDNKNLAKESKRANEKSQRLKELTEMIKRTGTTNPEPENVPPPIPPPRKQRGIAEASSASCTSLNTITKLDRFNDMESLCESIDEKTDNNKPSGNSSFLFCTPSALKEIPASKSALPEETEIEEKCCDPVSIDISEETTEEETATNEQITTTQHDNDNNNENDMFMTLPKVESRTIIGAYTQKNIPYRSASFSQVDYSSGKYIRSAINAFKSNLKSKQPDVVDNANLTLPRKKDTNNVSSSNQNENPASTSYDDDTTAATITEQREDYEEPLQFGNDFLPNDMIKKKSIQEDIIEESEEHELSHSDDIQQTTTVDTTPTTSTIELNVVQASEMILDQLCEEEAAISSSPNIDVFQTATTCLIPVPVYECVPQQEWDPNDSPDSPEWINACEDDGTKMIEEMELNIKQISNNLNDSPQNDRIDAKVIEINNTTANEPKDYTENFISNDEKCLQIDCKEKLDKELSNEQQDLVVSSAQNDNIEKDDDTITASSAIETPSEQIENNPIEIAPDSEQLPVISVTPSNVNVANSSDDSNKFTIANQLNVEVVEVRKRHSNDCKTEKINESASSSSDHSNDPQINPIDDRRKSDKSKRRKGMYIQWPAIEKQKNLDNDDWVNKHNISTADSCSSVVDPVWPCKKRDEDNLENCAELNLANCDFSSITTNIENKFEKLDSGNIAWISCKTPDGSDTPASLSGSFEPTTPESDSNRHIWPTKSNRKPSLTCQSSEEKDENIAAGLQKNSTTSKSNQKINLLRYESVSDNESDRTSPRERASQSPAPNDQDLKRYSKRPLRGPYGQMLEAEMKKPAKVHYDEILEELNHRSERYVCVVSLIPSQKP